MSINCNFVSFTYFFRRLFLCSYFLYFLLVLIFPGFSIALAPPFLLIFYLCFFTAYFSISSSFFSSLVLAFSKFSIDSAPSGFWLAFAPLSYTELFASPFVTFCPSILDSLLPTGSTYTRFFPSLLSSFLFFSTLFDLDLLNP